jgi:hypothetical protein
MRPSLSFWRIGKERCQRYICQSDELLYRILYVGLSGHIAIYRSLELILGSSYREGVVVVPVMALAYVLLGIYFNASIWIKLSGKQVMLCSSHLPDSSLPGSELTFMPGLATWLLPGTLGHYLVFGNMCDFGQ